MANRLANETSPYLLQHKDNPVDWYPWGKEAFEKARREDKALLLSVGYSACHWCHVMERESFEDPETAKLMNERFVNVKVDREERPDVDSIYMTAVQALTRSGGWPMTVFLTPDGSPFYGGTYFPPVARSGLPAFGDLLASVADAYRDRRDEILESAGSIRDFLRASTSIPVQGGGFSEDLLETASAALAAQVDTRFGGFKGAPKFPQAVDLEVLLRHYRRRGDESVLSGLELTLRRMAGGGIYDQLGGGFARYSVDERWLVPHFEKMLYDNALLSRLYLEAYQLTRDPLYRRVVEETIDYVLRDMTGPEGGFYSAEDADSEGEEGRFYVWTQGEIEDILSPGDARIAASYWGVTEGGNFEGRNILHVPRPPEYVADDLGLTQEELAAKISEIRGRLFAEREKRVRPGRDDKALAAWNGLMLRSLAIAAAVLDRDDYREAARQNAVFILEKLRVDGRLRRSYKDGRARIGAYLEDYACVADGLLALHEATLDAWWLQAAAELSGDMIELFWDTGRGAFYDVAADHEELVTRPRNLYDGATPSGNSVATEVLLKLSLLLDRNDYREHAETVLEELSGGMREMPGGFGRLLCALDFTLDRPYEVAIVGDPASGDTRALLGAIHSSYIPNKVVAGRAASDEETAGLTPLLAGRTARGGRATAYVCEGYACQNPAADPGELKRQLGIE